MPENKTKPTAVPVEEFLMTVGEQRASEARVLIGMMQAISGEPPIMWGPSIIGFGRQHYKTDAGREGDIGLLGFSPRKTALTIYFYEGFDRYGEELARLGKHKASKSCLYINTLSDIDLNVLQAMLQASYDVAAKPKTHGHSVDAYIAAIPAAARPRFDELRELVTSELPQAHEVMSYGIVGYKLDPKKRAVVFISGWKDHLGVYPIPKDAQLQKELAPHIKGKGTLWFMLDAPLPRELIRRTVVSLAENTY